jgi:hypothetical protein
MNPDYYKKNDYKTYKHELERVRDMDDYKLETRYGKMTKPDKIQAFYEALIDEDRAPKLRKKMAGNHGIKAPSIGAPQIKAPSKKKREVGSSGNILMKFIKVISNIENGSSTDKKALFHFGDSDSYFLYTYVRHEDNDGHCTMDETETFLADADGDILNSVEIFSETGYIPSTDAMNNTVAILESEGDLT